MRRLAGWIIGVACLGVVASVHAHEWSGKPELEARVSIQQAAETTYHQRRLEELDRRMAQFVHDSTRTSSGLWVTGIYYDGVRSAVLRDEPTTDEAWDALEQQTLAWARQRPASAIARLMHAEVIAARAWQIRGKGYASTVPEAAWAPFHNGLRRAEAYLRKEKAVAGTVPEYYTSLMSIARALGKPRRDMDALREECDRAHPGYYPIYFEVLNYLLPKWNGSAREIELFARAAVVRTQRSEGNAMYARIYWFAAQGDFENDLFWATDAQWALMKRGFEDVVKRYPDQWNYQNYAHFACQAGDTRTYTRLMAKHVQAPIFPTAWSGQPGYAQCLRLAGTKV